MLPTKFHGIGLLFQEKKQKIDFQDGSHHDSGDLRFWTERIQAIFAL